MGYACIADMDDVHWLAFFYTIREWKRGGFLLKAPGCEKAGDPTGWDSKICMHAL